MEKRISKFNISSEITKGNSKQLVICPKCKCYNLVSNKHKLTYQKIKTIACNKCHFAIRIGDIFNFTTGTKLRNRNELYNQNNFDNYIWNTDYDNI